MGSSMNKGRAGKADGESRWGGQLGLVGEKTLVEVDRCQPCLSKTCCSEP